MLQGLIQAQCVQNLLRRDTAKSSLWIRHLMSILVPEQERIWVWAADGWATL
jgi:hypothetical protein